MPAGRKLEGREVSESIERRSGAADFALERLQNLRAYRHGAHERRRTEFVLLGAWLHADFRGRGRARKGAPTSRGCARSLLRAHTGNPEGSSDKYRGRAA